MIFGWQIRSWMHFFGGFVCAFLSVLMNAAWVLAGPTILFCFYEFYQDWCCRIERREDSYKDIAEWLFAMIPGLIAGVVVKILGII